MPAQKGERKKRLTAVINEPRTMIFYEAPHKLKTALSDMRDAFGGERRISLCRELTKLNEEIIRTTLDGAIRLYSEKEPRGEYVLVLEGAEEAGVSAPVSEDSLLNLTPYEHVMRYIDGGMSKMDAIKAVAKERGVPKSEIYDIMIDE